MLDLKTADDIAFYFFNGCSRIFFISYHFIVFTLLLKGMAPSNDIELNRKKMKIEHMILYYRMKRQKINAEEKSFSSKCFTS